MQTRQQKLLSLRIHADALSTRTPDGWPHVLAPEKLQEELCYILQLLADLLEEAPPGDLRAE